MAQQFFGFPKTMLLYRIIFYKRNVGAGVTHKALYLCFCVHRLALFLFGFIGLFVKSRKMKKRTPTTSSDSTNRNIFHKAPRATSFFFALLLTGVHCDFSVLFWRSIEIKRAKRECKRICQCGLAKLLIFLFVQPEC